MLSVVLSRCRRELFFQDVFFTPDLTTFGGVFGDVSEVGVGVHLGSAIRRRGPGAATAVEVEGCLVTGTRSRWLTAPGADGGPLLMKGVCSRW